MKQHHSAIPSKNTKYQVAKRAPQKNRNKIPPMLKTLTYATYFSFLVQMACAKWWVHFEKNSLDCKRAGWIMRERERVSWFKAFKNEEEEKMKTNMLMLMWPSLHRNIPYIFFFATCHMQFLPSKFIACTSFFLNHKKKGFQHFFLFVFSLF